MPDFLTALRRSGVVGLVRTDRDDRALHLAGSIARGGVGLIELSCRIPNLQGVISQLRQELDQCRIGVGTITDRETAKAAIGWGVDFLFSPIYDENLIDLARDRGIPFVGGAATPTEIFRAWQRGVTAVKVFPIGCLGGSNYIKAIGAVFPEIPLLPTGGVNPANGADLLRAGAVGVGVSGYFFPADLVANGDWQAITDRAAKLLQSIAVS